MRHLAEIYWDIYHKSSEESISLSDESTMLLSATEEYVENLLKYSDNDRWKSIVTYDIDMLKTSSFIRKDVKGYSFGAELFLSYLRTELERYGLILDDADNSSIKGTARLVTTPNVANKETGNKEGVGNVETPKADQEPTNKDDIIKSLEGTEIFAPTKPINLYNVYYDRLTKGKIKTNNGDVCKLAILRRVCDDDNDNIELFKYCVERADISKLVNTGKKSYARLFMNDIASCFKEPEKFRKAAAKSFRVKEVGGVGGDYKENYRLLMEKLFSDDADYRKRGS